MLDSFNIGGAERQAINLAAGLKNEGHNVELIALSITGNGIQILKNEDLAFSNLNLTLYTHHPTIIKRNKRILRRVLKAKKPDVVFPFTYWPNLYCNALKVKARLPICIWNQRDLGFNLGVYKKEERILSNADWIVGNSKASIEVIKKKFSNVVFRSKVINNGIAEHFLMRRSKKISNKPRTAVMVANIHQNKDHKTLLRAWKLLKDKFGDDCPRLKLVGAKRNSYENLKEFSKKLGLTDVLEFTGMIDDVTSVIQSADFCVFSSNSEGSPNGLLECMAGGLPVVATDIDTIKEALGEEYNFLVPVNSPEIFAEKIIDLIGDQETMHRVGKLNHLRIIEHFSFQQMLVGYLDIVNS